MYKSNTNSSFIIERVSNLKQYLQDLYLDLSHTYYGEEVFLASGQLG